MIAESVAHDKGILNLTIGLLVRGLSALWRDSLSFHFVMEIQQLMREWTVLILKLWSSSLIY